MLYSNEVFLISTARARYTTEYSFSNIDLNDMSTYEGTTLDVYEYTSIASRLFKIIDVKHYSEDELEDNCFPVGVLLEPRYYTQDRRNVICRASDLLYMHKELISIAYHNESSYPNGIKHYLVQENQINGYLDAESMINDIASNGIYRRKEDMDVSVHLKLMESELVDKNDSRLIYSRDRYNGCNRFYLDKINSKILRNLIECQTRNVDAYYRCKFCKKIDNHLQEYSDYRICDKCYVIEKVDCEVCYSSVSIGNSNDISKAREMEKQMLELVEAKVCCNSCYGMFYVSCTRCKAIDIVDLEILRNCDKREKNDFLNKFKYRNRKYKHIMQRTYCNTCATFKLNNILFSPFRGLHLPNKYDNKTNFNRFIGIESEVITEYEGADHYYDNASIPMYFKVVEDGSLNGGGVEFVTERPVIGRQVDGALDSLEECNLDEYNSVDESCGVHIHINAIDFGFTELKSLLMIMSRIQTSIYQGLPNYRSKNYCREIPITSKEWASINDLPTLVNSYYNIQDSILDDTKYNEARYTGTNIHARFYMGSVEFRYHEGTIRSKPIEDWIRFLNKIMDTSTKLHKNTKLYSKIISTKTQSIDIVRDTTGVWGAEYIERRIDNNN
tara:strand:- start:944 stop:2785 length:1842 start_codon:yes stop_codon:yes gene_type:complete